MRGRTSRATNAAAARALVERAYVWERQVEALLALYGSSAR